MEFIEISAKNVDDALTEASVKLGISSFITKGSAPITLNIIQLKATAGILIVAVHCKTCKRDEIYSICIL